MGTAKKHPVPVWVKQSFIILDIRALWCSKLSVRVPGCQKYKWWHNSVWHGCFIAVHIWQQWVSKGHIHIHLRDQCHVSSGWPIQPDQTEFVTLSVC